MLSTVMSSLSRSPFVTGLIAKTEEVVVTKDGPQVITKFPAEELVVAGRHYYAASGPLPTTREAQSHLNRNK